MARRVAKAGNEPEVVEQVQEAADELAEKLTGIESELLQTKSRSFEDPLNYPGKITAQLANLQALVNSGADAPPTDGAVEFFAELRSQLDALVGRLRHILEVEVADFNELVAGLNLPPVVVSER